MKRLVLFLCATAVVAGVGIVASNKSGVCVLEGRVLSRTELRNALAEHVYQVYGSAVPLPPAQTPEEMLKRWPDCCILAQAESQRKEEKPRDSARLTGRIRMSAVSIPQQSNNPTYLSRHWMISNCGSVDRLDVGRDL